MRSKTTEPAKSADDPVIEVELEADLEDDGDEENDGAEQGEGMTAKKKSRKPRTVKAGDTVTLRRAGSCRKILLDEAKVKKIDGDQVATLEVLGGRSKGHVVQNVKRYNLDDAIGPTDQVLPSWVGDAFEVA